MVSTKGRYALRVMLDIAEHGEGRFLPLNEIAKRQNISEKYLESILVLLTRAKLLDGARGKGGGYKLTKRASEYRVSEIIRATEGSLPPVSCLKENATPCQRRSECKTYPLWKGLNDVMQAYLDGVTLEQLL